MGDRELKDKETRTEESHYDGGSCSTCDSFRSEIERWKGVGAWDVVEHLTSEFASHASTHTH